MFSRIQTPGVSLPVNPLITLSYHHIFPPNTKFWFFKHSSAIIYNDQHLCTTWPTAHRYYGGGRWTLQSQENEKENSQSLWASPIIVYQNILQHYGNLPQPALRNPPAHFQWAYLSTCHRLSHEKLKACQDQSWFRGALKKTEAKEKEERISTLWWKWLSHFRLWIPGRAGRYCARLPQKAWQCSTC